VHGVNVVELDGKYPFEHTFRCVNISQRAGATTCVSGYTCTYSNPCMPGLTVVIYPLIPWNPRLFPMPSWICRDDCELQHCASNKHAFDKRDCQQHIDFHRRHAFWLSDSFGPRSDIPLLPPEPEYATVSSPPLVLKAAVLDGMAILGSEASSAYFTIGTTISTNGLYLNLAASTTSYQALVFNSTAVTTDWGLEGDTIITTNPRQLNFLTCATSDPTIYTVYLQNGNDQPSGQTCSLTSLHLPCLC
jgi:hypothetical protein